ncbi:MAG TPA: 3'(2'),5'-bisphosphate nucleotidase CysQ [Caulobacteraceae bacterium]|jgi:3'(2'), 5'-bisphosphate nucleotidase
MGNADIGAVLARIVEEASAVIMPFWRGEFVLERKADSSPVTEADHAGEKLIVARLKGLFPDIPVIAEESSALYGVPEAIGPRFFLVDPVDGTKAFVRGDTHFTVNIGLIEDGVPVAGAVAAPAQARTWFTTGEGCRRRPFGEDNGEPVTVRPWPAEPVCLISHTMGPAEAEALKLQYGSSHTLAMDSSIKLCMIADGTADIYPRHGPTMEWDIAAAHAVLAAAGGTVVQPDGAPFLYGKADQGFRNGWFVARGGKPA